MTFCQYGCTYLKTDYELMTANCKCDSGFLQGNKNITEKEKLEQIESVNFKTITKSFISNLLDFNIEVIKCYNLVFNGKILIKNIGFYSMFTMFVLQLIFLFIFLLKKLKPLKNYMLLFNNNDREFPISFPPKKISRKSIMNSKLNDNKTTTIDELDLEKQKNKKYYNDKINQRYYLNNQNKNIINGQNEEISNESSSKKNFQLIGINDNDKYDDNNNLENILNNEEKEQNTRKNNLLKLQNPSDSQNQNSKSIFNKDLSPSNIKTSILNINQSKNQIKKKRKSKILKKERNSAFSKNKNNELISEDKGEKINNNKNIHKLETTTEKEEKQNTKKEEDKSNLSKTDYELQDMDYEEALIYDKRPYLKTYWAYLIDTQIILGTFCTENYLNLLVIKLSFFFCTFQISFFLNALFYTDEYISDAYHNNGVLEFFSGLPKSIYSFVATLITTNLLKMLSNSKSELMKLIREERKNKEYINLINSKLKKLRNKLIIYFILVFTLGSFFLYYVCAFCAVYKYSQKYWFFGCLESFAMDSLVALIICIVLAFFRILSLKKQIKFLYKLADIISTFL